ncbi:MAG: hydrolase, partial [Bacteroidota bacterium]|nr:hydrolase [Bacteroidota bacterium]
MKKIGCVVFLIFCALFSLSLNSQEIPKQYFTKQINTQVAPKLDGFLDDSIWGKVEWGSNFVEVSPDENTSPTEETKFKILFDQKYLYVALLALDSSP